MTVRHAASRLNQPGRPQALPGNQHARAKAERAGRSIRFFLQDAGDSELRVADLERVPHLQIEPDQQGLLSQRMGAGEQRRQSILGVSPQLPVERIARLHSLELDELRPGGHRGHRHQFADLHPGDASAVELHQDSVRFRGQRPRRP